MVLKIAMLKKKNLLWKSQQNMFELITMNNWQQNLFVFKISVQLK